MGRMVGARRGECPPRTTSQRSGGAHTIPWKGAQMRDSAVHVDRIEANTPSRAVLGVRVRIRIDAIPPQHSEQIR
jgi:hypothetical protein